MREPPGAPPLPLRSVTALRPLLLTGGPAVGKTTTARALAAMTEPCAYIDVDDLRQMVKNGGVAPWKGAEGHTQHLLGSGTLRR